MNTPPRYPAEGETITADLPDGRTVRMPAPSLAVFAAFDRIRAAVKAGRRAEVADADLVLSWAEADDGTVVLP